MLKRGSSGRNSNQIQHKSMGAKTPSDPKFIKSPSDASFKNPHLFKEQQ